MAGNSKSPAFWPSSIGNYELSQYYVNKGDLNVPSDVRFSKTSQLKQTHDGNSALAQA